MLTVVTWSVQVRVAILAAAVGLLILGFTTLPQIGVETLPEFSPTTVEVQTEALGLSAEEVEQLITVPLEQNLLNGVAFLERIESASLPGLSSVVMTFEPGTDYLTARQVVAERLTQAGGLAGLVQVAKPPQMLQPRSAASRVAMIRLSSSDQSLIEQSVLARWVIVPRLLGVEGVANVAIWGFRDRQLQVTVDPTVLGEHGVSLSQVVRTAGNALEVSPLSFLEASSPGTGGWIETVNQRLHIFHEQTINTPEELEQVPLAAPEGAAQPLGGVALTLGDVSEVVEDHQPLVGDAYCTTPDGGCLLLVVEAFPDANTLEVANGLDTVLESLRPGLGDIEIDTSIYRPADDIRAVFVNIGWTLAIGAALLLVVLVAYLRNWRSVLAVLIPVLLSIVVAGLVLYLRQATINVMIAAGLALGLMVIVGDTLLRVERVIGRLRRHDEGDTSPRRRLVDAVVEMSGPLFYAALIGAAGLVPMLFATGSNRVFASPIAVSYLLALGSSVVVAFTITPALAALLLAGTNLAARAPGDGAIERGYDRLSGRLVAGWRPALIVLATLIGIGVVSLPFLQTSLRPSLREGDVLVHLAADPGTSLSRMDEVMAASVEDIAAIPGVENVGAHVGRAVASDQVVDVYSGEIWVGLEASADYETTLSSIATAVEDAPDVSAEVLSYLQERIGEAIPEVSRDEVTVRVFGEDTAVLNATAEDVQDAVAGIDGVSRASLIRPAEQPTIEVEVDLEAAQDLGVTPGDVRREAAILLSGLTVGNLFEEQKVFDVVVWGQPDIRSSEEDVRRLLIETPGGGQVPLEDLADVRMVSSPAVIRHDGVMSYRDVVATVPEGDLDAVAAAVDTALDRVDFPLEYHAELVGDAALEGASPLLTWTVFAAAALAVFLLLQAAFGSWRLALLAFGLLAAALGGGIGAVLVTGAEFKLGSLAGLVGVLTISSRVAILVIRSYLQRQLRDGVAFGPDMVIDSTREWVGPILASTAATLALVVPMLVMGSTGMELLQPMAVVVVGGVITSAAIALGVLPSLYLRFGYVPEPDTTAELLRAAQPVERAHRPGR